MESQARTAFPAGGELDGRSKGESNSPRQTGGAIAVRRT